LPGVFETLPVQAVNGSLWVLLHFVALYVVLAVLGAFGVLDRERRFAAFIVAFIIAFLAMESGWLALPLPGKVEQLRVLAFPFLAACGAWVFRRRIVLDGRAAIALLAVAAASHFVLPRALALLALTAAEVYLVLFVALAFRPIRKGNRLGQYSYGVFLYGFPIAQCAVLAFSPGPYLLFLISVPLTFGIGFLSWELVERHALRLRKRPLPRVAAARREIEPEPLEAPR
ncbi:MAG TPA: hypothetical protein VK116_18875, partial [Planctomycetota bacterium]|nr:hypothetical protein [Planctomycetota bacterium]